MPGRACLSLVEHAEIMLCVSVEPEQPIQVVARVGVSLQDRDVVAAMRDPDALDEVRALLSELAAPEVEVAMVAPDYMGPRGRLSYSGPEGFIEAWREWVEAYESYTIEIEEVAEGTGGRVFTLGRQRGTTRTGGVEVEEMAAAVWTVRDGKLTRVEFHLDPEAGRRSAGLTG
jgi:hypothetical protein